MLINLLKDQKRILQKLEGGLTRTTKLVSSVHDEINDLKNQNISLRNSSYKICADLETTLEDAKETRKEFEKIKKIIQPPQKSCCYHKN